MPTIAAHCPCGVTCSRSHDPEVSTVVATTDLVAYLMLKKVFLAHFEPVVTGYGPPKIPKCLDNRLFWDQKGIKNRLKMCSTWINEGAQTSKMSPF